MFVMKEGKARLLGLILATFVTVNSCKAFAQLLCFRLQIQSPVRGLLKTREGKTAAVGSHLLLSRQSITNV